MTGKITQPLLSLERLEAYLQLELGLVILGLAIGAWLLYKLLLRAANQERHANLRRLFSNLLIHAVLGAILFSAFWALRQNAGASPGFDRLASYVGLLTILSGFTVFLKAARILCFEYLFLGHMREGVPVLLVNLLTLFLSIAIGGWIVSDLFSVQLAPILATSAIFSVVLGLAMQDTLGNLFAAMALQFDKPYEIGDWIEVQSGQQKWIGQVYEISWRATALIGMGDEALTIPNRVMAQSQVSNFNAKARPFLRNQILRVKHGTSTELAKRLLMDAALSVKSVRKTPAPFALVWEAGESWIAVKLIYYIDDYGSQFIIADQVLAACLKEFGKQGIVLAHPRLEISQSA